MSSRGILADVGGESNGRAARVRTDFSLARFFVAASSRTFRGLGGQPEMAVPQVIAKKILRLIRGEAGALGNDFAGVLV